MKRTILVCALLGMVAAALGAQQANQSNAYEGTSHPPPDDTITTPAPAPSAPRNPTPAKPPAGQPAAPNAASSPSPASIPTAEQRPSASADSTANSDDPDAGIVSGPQYIPAAEQSAQQSSEQQPALNRRAYSSDPDGDIVHPQPLPPGELAAGVTIRVELLDQLSTADSEKGDTFRSRVATDVLQNGQVLIPAGSELDGRVAESSSGHLGGHGTMRLRPEMVILPDGARYQLYADLTGTPDARAQVNGEGTIRPDSHFKRDTAEYGAMAGGGATTGAILGGPVGAVTGGLIGAGVVTAHLLINHPQATLHKGATLLFTLAQPLQLSPAGGNGD